MPPRRERQARMMPPRKHQDQLEVLSPVARRLDRRPARGTMQPMYVTRQVRLFLDREHPPGPLPDSRGGWWEAGAETSLIVQVTVTGAVDSRTGFLCNATHLDSAIREHLGPLLWKRWLDTPARQYIDARLLLELPAPLQAGLPRNVTLHALALCLTPDLAYTWTAGDSSMVSLTRSFEFAAAHRLHSSALSEEENRRVFGKCANPSGHGHNYVVEVTVGGTPDAASGMLVPLADLERTVAEHVITLFDHKHLNEDCPEFAQLNPSVENIARVIWDKLKGRFEHACLRRVRVYETPRTWADYDGE